MCTLCVYAHLHVSDRRKTSSAHIRGDDAQREDMFGYTDESNAQEFSLLSISEVL